MNKKLLVSAVTMLVIAMEMAGVAIAAGSISPTVPVTGVLNAVCKAGTAGSLSFTIDPSLAGPITASVTDATVFCSNGAPFTVTAASLNKGLPAASCASSGGGITGTLKNGGSGSMDYTFTCGVGGTTGNTGTGQGHGSGKDVLLGLSGSIAAVSYQNAPASAAYTDTVTLTISY